MKKQIEIKVPTDYSAITFKKWMRLQRELKNYEDEEDAQNMILVSHLCDLSTDIIMKLDEGTLSKIKQDLYSFLNSTDYELQRIVKIGDIEYGFEPNLSKMAYGAYLDISKFKDIQINDDWLAIMQILYRPITKKRGSLYEIEPYTGWEEWNKEMWEEVSMSIHFGGFFFFTRLYKTLLQSILNSTKNQMEMYPNIKSILEESGEIIHQLSNSPEKIYSSLIK